ncbi:N-acyl-D-glucosamine 2-epimerase [Zobellella endophytica]|uniref:N-acyl-D-glucosamine 2-epimerase n=1 Tax=Zobellella endophytica TaxID=2116700 RepID=A0A2P7R876_9GAMM|nr:N-acyl-D-glucosamine 2-epimerase [Zobellella endophytica]
MSDLFAGYIVAFDEGTRNLRIRSSNGDEISIRLGSNIYAEMIRNLGEDYKSAGSNWSESLVPGRYIYVYGIKYPVGGSAGNYIEAKRIVFPSTNDGQYVFENINWWKTQISQLADFYIKSQFGEGEIDFRKYRTNLSLEGQKLGDGLQEAATLSRLVYGFATAYLLTGNDKYWEAAQKGTQYLRDNFRVEHDGEIYWLHALNLLQDGTVDKITGSQFSDDYEAIPLYEQIYDLAGLTQAYRIIGDPAILDDINRSLAFFDSKFRDKSKAGGYFSHIDPSTFSAHAESLVDNKSRKNWNSIGDHAPAYLINLWLATENEHYAELLEDTFDTIASRFPADDDSPFVNERFFSDWQVDRSYKWQQDQAVVGHDLKIAWNLTRMNSLTPKPQYSTLAGELADAMPLVGSDLQRGGWYDVIERSVHDNTNAHHLAFHDRKAWWQQEQAILAYLIMAGVTGNETYMKHAREALSFYNAWFLDHEDGGVYFNVLANGLPYLNGVERQKGSHSMSGYHAFELAYLSEVYSKLLIQREPLDLYFRPVEGGFPDNILRVQPDILPKGKVKISEVWVDGESYQNFDADKLTISLPPERGNIQVKVRLSAI